VGRLRTFVNVVNEGGRPRDAFVQIRTIGHQSAIENVKVVLINRWQAMGRVELKNALLVNLGERALEQEDRVWHLASHCGESFLKIDGLAHAERLHADTLSLCPFRSRAIA